ncbi:uncharacterized protein E5676_scaffold314G00150 [Cucumis melo var. makuwa]|uniref:DUF4216 domain-containing protein n=1 Tax=Cucumis melo var. makuwa TaxID=1194695 RepID=A0A5A7UP82_CUCMM|nr:uncharacterized protein E6C27_scaffold221G00150 [Cucumis melo var. makuwa]TYK08927.1 uncharacterized protein E5676_scaffold314G00150 [Cucumis melo var. makuwa]
MRKRCEMSTIDHSLTGYDTVMREIQEGQVMSTTIRWIAHGLHPVVMIYEGYKVNGICYNTKSRDNTRTVQNSGVMFVASTIHVASAKDKIPIIADMSFYDSFILVSQARQVIYVKDPSDSRWSVVVKPKEKDFVDNSYNDELGDTSLHCSTILEYPADMTKEDEEIPYIRVDYEGTWRTFNSKLEDLLVWTITYQPMTLGKQASLEAGCSSVLSTKGVINKGKGTRGPTGMSKITRVSCDGHKRVVKYNELGQPIGESATKLKSLIGTTVRVHVSISYQSWKDVPTDLKDKICELIELAIRVMSGEKTTSTTTECRKGYANLAEEMKASTSSNGLIDRALVWKKARTTKDGEIPDIDTKEVANKIDNLLVSKRATHSIDNVTCDILSQAIGGNDPSRRIRGEGQYVTPKLEAKLMKHKRVPEVAIKGETDESKIKSQMASKSIDTSDDANDHDAKEENRQVLEDLIIEKQDKDSTSCRLVIGTKDNVDGTTWTVTTHLYKVMKEKGTLGSYKFADAGSVLVGISKEDRAQILNARLLGTDHRQILMFPYNSGNHWCLIAIDFQGALHIGRIL